MRELRGVSSSTPDNLTRILDLLRCWLSRRLASESLTWLEEKRAQVAQGVSLRVFFTAFSTVPRYTGKQDLGLTSEDLQAAETSRLGWFPGYWSLDQTARTLLLLSLPADKTEQYLHSLEQLSTTADVGELVALYQSLPLLPAPERHLAWAAEGIRSNMTAVFNAVALRNPYPADYFDDRAWNQMVLKAVFVGSPLPLVWGLDRRANPELARMLTDYVHERWAARRAVPPELWRLVGPFADAGLMADLEMALTDPDVAQQEAAALACSHSPSLQAKALLFRLRPDLQVSIQTGRLTWNSLSRQWLALC